MQEEAVSQLIICNVYFVDDLLAALNILVKPTAGVLGVVTHPIEGTIKSIRAGRNHDVNKIRILARYQEGIVQARDCDDQERQFAISTFYAFGNKGKGKRKAK